jgi:subtilisin family serine protease
MDIYQVQIPEYLTVEVMRYVMIQNPDVEYAVPNYILKAAVTPNDTLFQYQYNLHNQGQRVAPVSIPGAPTGKDEADIKATFAWEETKGDEEVIIAILDSGVDLNHPDIMNKLVSDGYDFVNNDDNADDDLWHGTHVAGIAAAETHNAEGIAGVAWNCKILPVKVLDDEGSGSQLWVAEGIRWAADNGADVINLSLGAPNTGNPSDFEPLRAALNYAYNKDVIIVASAGNEGDAVNYPAAFDAYVLAVAASDFNDVRTDWSNFGPEVDVAAPGDWILSLWPVKLTQENFLPYAWGLGTSASAPHVAGLAALIKSIKPWLNNDEIMDVIRYTADDINSSDNPGVDHYIGYGRINMERALVPIKIK